MTRDTSSQLPTLAFSSNVSAVQSGEKITNLDDLQDIDELHVIEVTRMSRIVRLQIEKHFPDVPLYCPSNTSVCSCLAALAGKTAFIKHS